MNQADAESRSETRASVITEQQLREAIRRMWQRLALWFLGSFALLIACSEIAYRSSGPAATAEWVIGLVMGGLGSLIFGIMLASFRSEAKSALSNLPHYKNDPEGFMRLHKSVFQIPWR